jgi:hypothetical protein
MSTVVFAAGAVAALACPAHMLWQMRRGRRASCMPAQPQENSVEALRRRQRDLEARIAELSVDDSNDDQSYLRAGRG